MGMVLWAGILLAVLALAGLAAEQGRRRRRRRERRRRANWRAVVRTLGYPVHGPETDMDRRG